MLSKNNWLVFGVLMAVFYAPLNIAFPNDNYDESEIADLLSHSAPEMGRLAIIQILGDYVITIPEQPSSPPNSDFIIRAWDISDPKNPVEAGRFGGTNHPFLAHGSISHLNEIYVGGYPNDAIRLNADGSLARVPWTGPEGHWNKSGMMRPWAAKHWWSYNDISGSAWLELDGVQTAEWDHLGQTGVVGMPIFMGNIMLYAADQSKTGVAAYDVSNPSNPQLLDVLKLPNIHPYITKDVWANGGITQQPVEYGLGGYWAEVSGHYIVFARRGDNPGIQIVDFSDPSNLTLQCEFLARDPAHADLDWGPVDPGQTNPMYVGFQDEWVFAGEFKVNVETCEADVIFAEVGNNSDGSSHAIDTSQYARPIGNLLVSGGQGSAWWWPDNTNGAGMGVWVHDNNRDTNPPYVSYHIPKPNQTNYPVMAPLSFMIPETLDSRTIRMGDTVTLRRVSDNSDIPMDYVLSHTGVLTVDPDQYLQANTTYEVTLAGIEDAVGNAMQSYSFRFSTGSSVDGGDPPPPPPPANVAPVINNIDRPTGQIIENEMFTMTVAASDADGDSLEYRYRVNNESYSSWGNNNQFSLSFSSLGSNSVTVQVRDPSGDSDTQAENFIVVAEIVPIIPNLSSSQIAYDNVGSNTWVVNPDNDTITKIDSVSHSVIGEYSVGDDPRSIALDSDGNVWVTLHGSDAVEVYSDNGQQLEQIDLGYGSAPFGIVINPQSNEAYVSLYGSGELARINTSTRAVSGRLVLGQTVRALAITPDGDDLLATRFISGDHWGEVWRIDVDAWSVTQTIPLHKNIDNDDLDNGRGLPNYLSSIVINSDASLAYVVGKKDNIDRGLINGGDDLDDDNTVRTLAMIIDLNANEEEFSQRLDFDNTDSPSALVFSPDGNYLFASMQGRNQVLALSVTESGLALNAQFAVGHAPQAVYMAGDSSQLMVKNFMDRSVSFIDLNGFLSSGSINPDIVTVNTVSNEVLDANVLAGKRIFYDAADGIQQEDQFNGRISAEGYISCASCHIDGGHDGRTYDFTGRGEGLRNNISLKGRGGVRFGPVHWTANFDEIQDFENDIRNVFLGSGLMDDADFTASENPLGSAKAGLSTDLDNLAAYVESLGKQSLPRSPYRTNNGGLNDAAVRGQTVFAQQGCQECHRGQAFTDGSVHDLGTSNVYSGTAIGEAIAGFKTPSLLGLFDSAPYLHDGSAASVEDVFVAAGGTVYQAESLPNEGELIEVESGYSYFRDGAAVRLSANDSIDVSSNLSPGTTTIKVRYGSSQSDSSLRVSVGGEDYDLSLQALPQVVDQDANFSQASITFELASSETSFSITHLNTGGATVIVDDVTVVSAEDFAAANDHTKVNSLSAGDQSDLLAYLLSLDQASAPSDDANIVLGPLPEGETNTVFVVGVTPVLAADAAVQTMLEDLGLTVTVIDDDQLNENVFVDRELVVISSSTESPKAAAFMASVNSPVVVWEPFLFDNLGLTGAIDNTDMGLENNATMIDVVNDTHPITASLFGLQTVYTQANPVAWGVPSDSATVLATTISSSTQATVFVYDEADALVNGSDSGVRRVGLFATTDADTNVLTAVGLELIENSINWVMGNTSEEEPPTEEEPPVDEEEPPVDEEEPPVEEEEPPVEEEEPPVEEEEPPVEEEEPPVDEEDDGGSGGGGNTGVLFLMLLACYLIVQRRKTTDS